MNMVSCRIGVVFTLQGIALSLCLGMSLMTWSQRCGGLPTHLQTSDPAV